MAVRGITRCAIVFFLTLAPLAPLGAEVRPISEAERAAVSHALAYLSGGPDALVKQLSTSSPLRKLTPADAAKELEVRLGPATGATWELETVVPALSSKVAVFNIDFPSGVDETATFELSKDGSSFKIDNVRILAEESQQKAVFPLVPVDPEKKKNAFPVDDVVLALGVVAAVIGGGSAFVMRSSRAAGQIALSVATAAALGGLALALLAGKDTRIVKKPTMVDVAATARESSYPRLASLLDARRAMAAGAELNVMPSREKTEAARNVAMLWKAQMDLQQLRTVQARQTLDRFPVPSTIPQVEILRGRAALSEQDDAGAAFAYEHAVSLGPGRDGLWGEAAHALLALGFDDRGMRYLNRLDRMGSRDADVYYLLSMYSASHNHEEDAEKLLKTGWALRPARRADVIGAPVLWSVVRRPGTATAINLSSPEEPPVAPAQVGTRAIDIPPGATTRVAGDFLSVQIGEQELRVPGGASLAPAGTPTIDAATWGLTEQEKALHDFTRIASAAKTAGAYAQPALRRRITESAMALAERNRWVDLISLTDGVAPQSDHIPPILFFLRAKALERLQRTDDAKQLLTALAAGHVLQRKRDARSLEQLGMILGTLDLYDAAVRILDMAQSIKPNERIEYTVTQILMNKRLATKYSTYNSPHFEIHYPEDVSGTSAATIAGVLEGELRRMQPWVATPNFRPVVVNILWWKDFRSAITGNDYTAGIYQGKITVPLAGLERYPPEIVAILTHELCHAMIAQATADQAPHWFQEGMAQRVEMVGITRNAFNMYDDSKLLAFSLLDSVLRDSPDPEMIGEGYVVSAAAIRYIEAKYGKQGIARMIEQYRGGATTEQAIQALSGTSMTEFDRQFRAWGRSEQRVFETPIVARYDEKQLIQTKDTPPVPLLLQPAETQEPQQHRKLSGGTLYPVKHP